MATKEYSIDELRNILFSNINHLMEIEPYWKKCINCPHQGKCCIDADISIREDEWGIIKHYILSMNNPDKAILKHNIINNKLCPFRASDKCLIHDIRPMNCIYTPFQVVQNVNNRNIIYSMIDDDCNFKSTTINHQIFMDNNVNFLRLDSFDKKLYYLFLNNFFINIEHNTKYNYMNISELSNEIQALIC